nr:TMEM175 family protein [uncultured Methanoregula sp.]
MEDDDWTENKMHLTKGRLEGLSDGIFAFAMTFLVISLIPGDLNSATVFGPETIETLLSAFTRWILGFVILGAFWLDHHIQYQPIQRIDGIFVWLNLTMLMFVSLLPFSVSFAGHYGQPMLGRIIFYANILAIGLCMSLQWMYATAGHRLVDPNLKRTYIQKISCSISTIPVVSVFALLFALAGFWWGGVFFLTLPFLRVGIARMSRGWVDTDS